MSELMLKGVCVKVSDGNFEVIDSIVRNVIFPVSISTTSTSILWVWLSSYQSNFTD